MLSRADSVTWPWLQVAQLRLSCEGQGRIFSSRASFSNSTAHEHNGTKKAISMTIICMNFPFFFVPVPPSNVKLTGPLQAKRGDTVTLTCATEVSNPSSQITWVVDGSRVIGGDATTTRLPEGWVTSSNLTITLTRQVNRDALFVCFVIFQSLSLYCHYEKQLFVTFIFCVHLSFASTS